MEFLFAMSPAPSLRHQWLSINIGSELRTAIKKSKCKNCKVYDFIDVKMDAPIGIYFLMIKKKNMTARKVTKIIITK